MEHWTFIASKEVVALTLCDLKQLEISFFIWPVSFRNKSLCRLVSKSGMEVSEPTLPGDGGSRLPDLTAICGPFSSVNPVVQPKWLHFMSQEYKQCITCQWQALSVLCSLNLLKQIHIFHKILKKIWFSCISNMSRA